MEQMTIFDYMEPNVGEYVERSGAVICHIMIPSYIGHKVLYDCSTDSQRCFRCGILEKYIPYEGSMRCVIYIGKKQRALVTRRDGHGNIFETLPWDFDSRRKDHG